MSAAAPRSSSPPPSCSVRRAARVRVRARLSFARGAVCSPDHAKHHSASSNGSWLLRWARLPLLPPCYRSQVGRPTTALSRAEAGAEGLVVGGSSGGPPSQNGSTRRVAAFRKRQRVAGLHDRAREGCADHSKVPPEKRAAARGRHAATSLKSKWRKLGERAAGSAPPLPRPRPWLSRSLTLCVEAAVVGPVLPGPGSAESRESDVAPLDSAVPSCAGADDEAFYGESPLELPVNMAAAAASAAAAELAVACQPGLLVRGGGKARIMVGACSSPEAGSKMRPRNSGSLMKNAGAGCAGFPGRLGSR